MGTLNQGLQPRPKHMRGRSLPRLITPDALQSILRSAELGDMERFAELAEEMLTDPHVSGVYTTFVRGITESELVIEASQEGERAEAIARFVSAAWSKVERSGEMLDHLLHGEGVFAGVVEQRWTRATVLGSQAWVPSAHERVSPRDVAFGPSWDLMVRIWEDDSYAHRWVRIDDDPRRWIAHTPGSVGLPLHRSGVLMACAWPWLFKRWGTAFRQQALERLASPSVVGTVNANALDEVREKFRDALENLAANGAMVIEDGQAVEIIEASRSGSEEWSSAIRHYEDEITKAILGSVLATEGGDAGGNRALGAVQVDSTIVPRLESAAKKLGETLLEQWVRPLLAVNRRIVGDNPPEPAIRFAVRQAPQPEIEQLHVLAGAVTVNELRASIGLPPLSPEDGGEERARFVPQTPAPPDTPPV